MRFLHTADWHINKYLGPYSLLKHQENMLEQIIKLLETKQYDALIIAGDLFDKPVTSNEALKLMNRFFDTVLLQLEVPIFLISGNHDNGVFIEYGSSLNTSHQFYNIGLLSEEIVSITLKETTFHLLPFVNLYTASHFYQTHFETYQELLNYQLKKINLNPNTKNVCLYHGYVSQTGEQHELSEADKPLSIGMVESVDVHLFKDFDYVALGHIHACKKVAENVWYSGSLYPYSKTESNYIHGVLDVDLDRKTVTQIPFELDKKVIVKKGLFDDILAESSEDFIFIELEDTLPISLAMSRLSIRYPYIVTIQQPNLKLVESLSIVDENTSQSLVEKFQSFYQKNFNQEMSENQLKIIQEAFNHED